ncbi:MAG: 4-hydroxythreonine-4-phosphate dehydrogenase PdxA [Planctomycetes bacterium]|nr:4-hydroxythreonine-4-phosphate dehydrogenase PdxA [Planctomycetota bacterium]
MEHEKPLLAMTLGDPAGVGPEIIAAAWSSPELHAIARPVAVGHPAVLRRAVKLLGSSAAVLEVDEPDDADPTPAHIPCLPCGSDDAADAPPAVIDARGGQAAYDALVRAAELAKSGRVDGIVTAPLHKAALWEAGHRYPGHTELLAELCGVRDVAMMLYLAPGPQIHGRGGLGVAHVTLHMALRDVFSHLTVENIVSRVRLADDVMRAMLHSSRHTPCAVSNGTRSVPATIGVCALNPHAGEQGLFGDEEQRVIAPAVEQARSAGFVVEGPLPADTLLARAAAGEFDAVVAMYHDQGHIALKLLGMHRAVNVTLGLPIIRTSVAHGTAFDLAWQGRAEWSGLVEAVRVATKLANSEWRVANRG